MTLMQVGVIAATAVMLALVIAAVRRFRDEAPVTGLVALLGAIALGITTWLSFSAQPGTDPALLAEFTRLKTEVAASQSASALLERERDAARALAAAKTIEVTAIIKERDTARTETAARTQEIAAAITERDTARAGVAAKTQEIAGLTSERDTARSEVAAKIQQMLDLVKERDVAKADAMAATSDLANVTAARDAAEQDVLGKIAAIADRVRQPGSGLDVAGQPPPAVSDAAPSARIAAELDWLATLRGRPEAPPPSAANLGELVELRDKMATKLETPNYDVEVYPDKELIAGKQGKYYVVDMKKAASGIRYYFPGGQYTLAQSSEEFRSSLNAFVGDVLKKLDGRADYQLFVRGAADRVPYRGKFATGREYREISYMPYSPENAAGTERYLNQTAIWRKAGPTIDNADLPNLRAAYLREILAETYPVKPPVILQGRVTDTASDRDRNAEILLYVDW